MSSDDERVRNIAMLTKLAGDLKICLAAADDCDEGVIAANLEHALVLVEARLAAHGVLH